MKKRTIKFELNSLGNYYNKDIKICCNGLREYFKIPKKTPIIWVTISRNTLEDGYQCRLSSFANCIDIQDSDCDWERKLIFKTAYHYLRGLVGYAGFYVSVSY